MRELNSQGVAPVPIRHADLPFEKDAYDNDWLNQVSRSTWFIRKPGIIFITGGVITAALQFSINNLANAVHLPSTGIFFQIGGIMVLIGTALMAWADRNKNR